MTLLFDLDPKPIAIEGLRYIPDFVTPSQEADLITQIDQGDWLIDLKRRVQHYGYRYDYKARRVDAGSYLGPLPAWLTPLSQRLYKEGLFSDVPDQAIVNEYNAGQGISAHIDCVTCFGAVIVSLSLGSGASMQFIKDGQKKEIYLEPRSLIVLSGSARFEWQHSIPARKSDFVESMKIERGRRVSVTFRTIVKN